MIKANRLSVGYGEKVVLKDLSFSLPSLSTTLIVGPGGSGKSTLLKVLSGNYCKATLWQKGSFTISSKNLAYLPQKPFQDDRTLKQVLVQNTAQCFGISHLLNCWQTLPKIPDLLLKNLDKPFVELPPLLQRLVQFSITMDEYYNVVLLDEPDANTNYKEQDWIIKKLQAAKSSKTIMVITHNLSFTYEIADYVIFMLDGKIIESAEKEKFFHNPKSLRTKQFITLGS